MASLFLHRNDHQGKGLLAYTILCGEPTKNKGPKKLFLPANQFGDEDDTSDPTLGIDKSIIPILP